MRTALLGLAFLLSMTGCTCGPQQGNPDSGTPATDGGEPVFPADPIFAAGAPAGAPTWFGSPESGEASGGPCLVDPELGSLFPRNWLRLRFKLAAPSGQNLFEIRLRAASEPKDLVVYTASPVWLMPADLWARISSKLVGEPIQVAVRGATYSGSQLTDGPRRGSSGTLRIAPAEASGSIVYWTTSEGTKLKGFFIGSESVQTVLEPTQVGAACVGCHTSTPDGVYAAFSASSDTQSGDPSKFGMRSLVGGSALPSFVTATAAELMARVPTQQPAFSPSHWAPGDRIALAMGELNSRWEITWIDLEATSLAEGTGWGVITRTGDSASAGAATFSHDGQTIAYFSAPTVYGGTWSGTGGADLYTVPYNQRQGGAATKVPGASSASHSEYYPAFSPDDELLAFTRGGPTESTYNNANAEIFVIPVGGGTALRLEANSPPACSGKTSPGVTNSWPKWAPNVATVEGKTYYWLTFSSTRADSGLPQIFVAPVVREGQTLTSYPALSLWNQPENEANHTPAWDLFQIP